MLFTSTTAEPEKMPSPSAPGYMAIFWFSQVYKSREVATQISESVLPICSRSRSHAPKHTHHGPSVGYQPQYPSDYLYTNSALAPSVQLRTALTLIIQVVNATRVQEHAIGVVLSFHQRMCHAAIRFWLGRLKMLHTARTNFHEKLDNGSSVQVDVNRLTIKSIGGL